MTKTSETDRHHHILIVEDQQIIAAQLQAILHDLGYQQVHIAPGYEKAVGYLTQNEVDLALLDIRLGASRPSGIELANYIAETSTIPFLFITAHADEETVRKAKTTRPAGYIVKPFDRETIFASVEIALHSTSRRDTPSKFLQFHANGHRTLVPVEDILFLKADGNFTEAHGETGRIGVSRKSLADFEKDLKGQFTRSHRSYLIRLAGIRGYSGKRLRILGYPETLPIGRAYKRSFQREVEQFSVR